MSLPQAYYRDSQTIIFQGHALDVLRRLPAKSVQCVVTSPPYFGQRDYGLEQCVWDAADGCKHTWGSLVKGKSQSGSLEGSTLDGAPPGKERRPEWESAFCLHCGAWRGSLGHEPTPDLYIRHLVEIFREVRRVLKDNGVCWIVAGDSYSGSGKGQMGNGQHSQEHGTKQGTSAGTLVGGLPTGYTGLKPKDLIGVPWRLAFALQQNGWYLRSDVIYAKTNCMPESLNGWRWERHRIKVSPSARAAGNSAHSLAHEGLRPPQGARDGRNFVSHASEWQDCLGCSKCSPNDGYVLRKGSWRPTRSHEYIFMLAKSSEYFGDREAVKEPLAASSIRRIEQSSFDEQTGGDKDYGATGVNPSRSARKALENLAVRYRSSGNKERKTGDGSRSRVNDHLGSSIPWQGDESGRNKRDVWWLSTKPFAGPHYAAFPESVAETPILSSTSEKGNCSKCGAPWVRTVEKGDLEEHPQRQNRAVRNVGNLPMGGVGYSLDGGTLGLVQELHTTGWRPTCSCSTDPEPAIVLDPFVGSGTTGIVAKKLGRRFVGIDLSEAYCEMATRRIKGVEHCTAYYSVGTHSAKSS